MPELFLEEINRWNDMTPGMSDKPYVQWQRGPLTKTPVPLMKSWVDTLVERNNVWLVLTFHGVDGIGWEAKPHEELAEYFSYMKEQEDKLWIAPFGDVTKYMREKMAAKVEFATSGDEIHVKVTHALDTSLYNYPLTLKTYVPEEWSEISVIQGNHTMNAKTDKDGSGTFVLYSAVPNGEAVVLKQ